MMNVSPVYVWLPDHRSLESALAGPDSEPVPAIRAWGDALIEMTSERSDVELSPSVAIRRSAIFAWLTRIPPESRAASTAGRVSHRLHVKADECAVARVDLVDMLFDPRSWRRFTDWCADHGYERGFVDEEVTPASEPLALMRADRARGVVESIESSLKDDLLGFFAATIGGYLTSWRPLLLADVASGGDWEVVVPRSAIVNAD